MSADGFKRIEVLARPVVERAPIRNAFIGRWIVSPEENFRATVFHEDFVEGDRVDIERLDAEQSLRFAFAETRRGQIAAYLWRSDEGSDELKWANLSVYENAEKLKTAETLSGMPIYPDDVLVQVLCRMGQPYTVELDI